MLSKWLISRPDGSSAVHNHGISNLCGFQGALYVMGPDDVNTLQDQRCLRSQRTVKPVADRRVFPIASQNSSDERLPRHSRQQGKVRLLQFGKVRQQGVILLEPFPETEPRIEHQPVALDSRQSRCLGPLPQVAL